MLTRKWTFSCVKRTLSSNISTFRSVVDLSDEVSQAVANNRPLVALESTIITHGMPHPANLSTARAVEEIVRSQGAVPATIAVLDGRVKVGLTGEELEFLADPVASSPVKISRRDLPYVLSHKLNGGTTVSATLLIARHIGIKIFVTGGIGGVHRQGESTLDISADLREMGRQPVMVISSGVKSILDIERTLEYLETEGVCVMTYGPSRNFPAFYSDVSGISSPYHVTKSEEAARVLHSATQLSVGSGILLAVPVPKQFSIEHDMMEAAINLALDEADKKGISGKEVTPFILNRISNITEGKSLESNIALIKNNAHIGSKVAVEYQKLLTRPHQPRKTDPPAEEGNRKTVVIGGSVLDCVATLKTELKADGRTLPGSISQMPGGVGRNIADALAKLVVDAPPPLLITSLGRDQFGQFLADSVAHTDDRGVEMMEGERTASFFGLVDNDGEARIGVGDFDVFKQILPPMLLKHEHDLKNSELIVIDGNLPLETMEFILNFASNQGVPVWFEPTDLLTAAKPFRTDLWKTIACASPNIDELIEMAGAVGVNLEGKLDFSDFESYINQILYLALPIASHIPLLMVTMGQHGLLMITKYGTMDAPLQGIHPSSEETIFVRYYPTRKADRITNCLGAGDSTVAGFIAGLLRGLREPECIHLGQIASLQALSCQRAIPEQMTLDKMKVVSSEYREIHIGKLRRTVF